MRVSILSYTPNADRLVCATARGDYMESSLVGVNLSNNVEYSLLMENIEPYDGWDEEDYYPSDPTEHDAKTRALIEDLIRKGHFGPFEHPQITFAVEGISRSCMAQVTRHRHATFDVQSMRYVNFEDAEPVTPETVGGVSRRLIYQDSIEDSFEKYRKLVDDGVPEEDARMVLPIGTKVNMTATFNLRSLMHVIDMRHAGDAQWEARDLAEQFLEHAEGVAPITFEEYKEHAKGSSKKAP